MTAQAPLTVKQAAEALNVSPHTIRAWVAKRTIGYVKLQRALRIPRAEIERMLLRGMVPPIRPAA